MRCSRTRYALLLLLMMGTTPLYSWGQVNRTLPELEGVGVVERLNNPLPFRLEFTNDDGRKMKISELFDGQRPVLLTLNYSNCPMLCSLQLDGLVDGLKELAWTPGDQFRMATVSIDPLETPTRARLTKQTYIERYERPAALNSWTFLVGPEAHIKAVAEAVGFGYRWNEERQEFMHAAVTMVLTPDGRVSRYLYGVQYDARTLRLALVEASEGKIGSTLDQIILYCYQYDAHEGRYTPAAMAIMRLSGGTTLVVIALLVLILWRRGPKRHTAVITEQVNAP
ncbi:MAG: hypothetical protein HJJLKODD_01882 [Phycisphaerae bacterium]|nr:hypothetical protein [Phycisphaerae bacterium]